MNGPKVNLNWILGRPALKSSSSGKVRDQQYHSAGPDRKTDFPLSARSTSPKGIMTNAVEGLIGKWSGDPDLGGHGRAYWNIKMYWSSCHA
jgi:hypothetical protein